LLHVRLLSVIKERDESATALRQLKQQLETSEGRLRALEQNSADVDRDLIESAKRCKEAEEEADRHRATVRMLKDKVRDETLITLGTLTHEPYMKL